MSTNKSKIIKQAVVNTLERAGMKGDDLIKHAIIVEAFYKEIHPFIGKCTTSDQILIMNKFVLFVIQYETLCSRSFRPLSGNQSVARTIIDMYNNNKLFNHNEPERITSD